MSWLFGSTKKKEPPHVTVDPTPIDGFCVVRAAPPPPPPSSTSHSSSLYPNLNPVSPAPLPYNPSPTLSSDTTSTLHLQSGRGINEVQNQLDSVPFRIAPHLEIDVKLSNNSNKLVLNEFTERLNKVKHCIENGEFEYDFNLEKRIIREAKMVNGHIAY
ncbi:uncharacterized protein LOC142328220 [Lycorma delicatula]|uniref:uncharacterized protein LOC142328220 n=1 Tax=Lycorma delicatula TaxID=130591 RepID=UPI003F516D64